ncbi:MAG: PKD domain-containing protein [Bacteroidota bacterium]|nr:PKD domain-containing protein [Bacteroidota bacterium]MDX5431122.1 PKD domain-containing protein [Bacteroidota bacterium]MDX5469871.1 PKD domain-containing protein [Bacteroidota bacterium]
MDVSFVDSTGNATSWEWNFGDGPSSTQQFPNHSYADTGTYVVCLKVTNNCGSDSICKMVKACQLPHASYSYEIRGDSVVFFNQSTGADSYLWLFGDGGKSSDENPFYRYVIDGNYQVCLRAINSCGMHDTCLYIPYIHSGLSLSNDWGITVYPNPAKSSSLLSISGKIHFPLNVQILDMSGKMLRQEMNVYADALLIERKSLSAGTYLLRVNDATGNRQILRVSFE